MGEVEKNRLVTWTNAYSDLLAELTSNPTPVENTFMLFFVLSTALVLYWNSQFRI